MFCSINHGFDHTILDLRLFASDYVDGTFLISVFSLQEQYRFIFDLMLLFLDSFSIYSNFK